MSTASGSRRIGASRFTSPCQPTRTSSSGMRRLRACWSPEPRAASTSSTAAASTGSMQRTWRTAITRRAAHTCSSASISLRAGHRPPSTARRSQRHAEAVNRLSTETSPYLLQHAENPVDWYPWGDEALTRAREEDKPILLSVGYSACHWCHVMAHESFEDEATAAAMNENFVCVKVDREERPAVGLIYMAAFVSLTGQGGGPMTVFLPPGGEPFFGGTYFPPEPRHGLPAFKQVLLAVAEAWNERRDEVYDSGGRLVEHIRSGARLQVSTDPLTSQLLTEAQRNLGDGFDPNWGGWGRAPKFPPAPVLEFLLR